MSHLSQNKILNIKEKKFGLRPLPWLVTKTPLSNLVNLIPAIDNGLANKKGIYNFLCSSTKYLSKFFPSLMYSSPSFIIDQKPYCKTFINSTLTVNIQSKQMKDFDNISKSSWRFINQTRNKTLKSALGSLDLNGKKISQLFEVPEVFNKFFSNAGMTDCRTKIREVTGGKCSSMILYPVRENEVKRVVRSLKNKTAMDINGLSTSLVKKCIDELI